MIRQDEIDALLAQYVEAEGELLDDTPPQTEQREDLRWKVFDQYAFLYFDTEHRVRIRDLSRSGMRIADAPGGLTVGATVRIIALHGLLDVPCQVIHLFELDETNYAGLKFLPECLQELAPLVDDLNAEAPEG